MACAARALKTFTLQLSRRAASRGRLVASLLRNYDENLTSGKVLGMMLVEGARRYSAETARRQQARKVLG